MQTSQKAQNSQKKKCLFFEKIRNYLLPSVLIGGLFVVILLTITTQCNQIWKEIHNTMQSSLHTNAQILSTKFDSLFTSLEAVAPLMAQESGLTKEEMLNAMCSLRTACGFDFVVRTNTDGIGMNYLGAENIDLSAREYIQKALGKNRVMAQIDSGVYDPNSSYIILAVPIIYNGKCVGVLHGSWRTEIFTEILISINKNTLNTSVITKEGSVIASSNRTAAEKAFAVMPPHMREALASGKSDYDSFVADSLLDYYYYTPLNSFPDCSWFLVSQLAPEYITHKTSSAYNNAIIIFIAASAITVALISVMIKRQKLISDQVRQAQLLSDALAVAESAGNAKSRFLSNMSHEMRTPLNAIIGFLALSKDATPKQMETYLEHSEIAAKQLISVINDVLDMSSIESGKLKISQYSFDFKQLIYSITNIYVALCQEKGIEYETKLLTPIDEWLIGDQLRVNQILINLLGNAVKFTSKGHIYLEISQTYAQDDCVFMHFEVSDTGCGMNSEMKARLFKPFEQQSAETVHKYGGSGLGLSIVKNLVSMMGGAVRAESTLNEGSTFIVDLPFKRSESQQHLPTIKGVDAIHVLSVDDDQREREYISVVLSRIGVRFLCVNNGIEAIAELERAEKAQDPYHICLVDWKMPHIDGAETTRMIRSKYGKDVVVIVVSAYDHNQADEEAKKAGANLFVPKPLFQSSLFDLFMTLTKGHVSQTSVVSRDYNFMGKRILLVEDNEMNRIVGEAIIKKLGAQCEMAFDGQIAFDTFSAAPRGYYDAILMDVQMPNVDGLEATRMIRNSAHPDAKTVQIIALTANAFNEDIAKTFSAGMNNHVTKPIEIEDLALALNQAFAKNAKS